MNSAIFAMSNLVEQLNLPEILCLQQNIMYGSVETVFSLRGLKISKTQAFPWYKEFIAGHTDDLPRFCHPSTSLTAENIVFFDCCGVDHSKFLPPGQTVNKEYYVSILSIFGRLLIAREIVEKQLVVSSPMQRTVSHIS